ncbi:uncharacterized protein [Typha angustifolia]|uniref:uncharacterized protein n=1 Tax=Typha angustifolia TaxID=59011 RepID=UPI003C2F2604
MDFDEYEYLEKAVEEEPEIRKSKDKEKDSSRSRHGDRKNDESEAGRKPREEEQNGRSRKGEREDRDRSSRREKDQHRRSSRDDERERRSHDRNPKERDGERERDKEKERSSKDDERERRSRDRNPKERDGERERDKEREKEKEKEKERERDKERERERERERRSSSRSRREAEREMERARSRERAIRERELEREVRERESRRYKEKKEIAEPEADPERDQRTVFAFQMPLKATERDVYEFFSRAGKVRDVRLIMDRNSRKSKGVGYIEFYDVMSVPQAIALSGQLLLGQPVMVKPSEAEKNLAHAASAAAAIAGSAAERKLYVGNLHFNMTEDQIRQIFEPFGPVELVQLPLDIDTGHCRGYAFVQFAQLEHAKAAQSLNGKLDIAGRIIKVSAVTDHVGVKDAGANAADLDDEDGGGLSLNAHSRAILMQKLDRTGTASSIAGSLGAPMLNGAAPSQALSLPINGQALVPAVLAAQRASSVELNGEPSECLLLTNMFNPNEEMEPDYDLEIKDDVQEECSKFGHVKHIHVDKGSTGHVYLRFDTVAAAASCQRAMHGRWFAGRSISATFMRPHEYEAKFR